ncbi:hypothetical protein A2U01_0081968 [Trifolium medium]|uniref:Uncharacterized protein n=1 Tax=Trifolium medium TaxID=97028 RepID=A0A392TID4_9FABA|nr:hypothetical protein [Trifolium medium]
MVAAAGDGERCDERDRGTRKMMVVVGVGETVGRESES